MDECEPVWEEHILFLNEVEETSSQLSEEEILQAAVKNLNKEDGVSIKNSSIEEKRIITWNLDELHPADAPYCYAFELTDCIPTSPPPGRFLEKMKKIAKGVIDMILKAKVIKLVNSPWESPVVIERKKDG